MSKRCWGRTKKNKTIWKTHFSHYSFGTRCTRPCLKNKKLCKIHSNNNTYGIYDSIKKPENIVLDIDDDMYNYLKTNNMYPVQFQKANLSIEEFINMHIESNRPKIQNNAHLKYVINAIDNTTDDMFLETISKDHFEKEYKNVMEYVKYEPKTLELTINTLKKKLLKRNKKIKVLNSEYKEIEKWWDKQYKVQIIDYDTKKNTVLAIEFNDKSIKKLYTKAKVHIGNCEYWTEKLIPSIFKNEYGIIIDPDSFCYLFKFHLFHKMKCHHSLPKSEYYEYAYVKKYNILRKTHEVTFI